jgi:hypothetical protein
MKTKIPFFEHGRRLQGLGHEMDWIFVDMHE